MFHWRYGADGILRTGSLWWRERDWAWDRSSRATFRHLFCQSSWLCQLFRPGTCCLEIKLFFTSTCLAKQSGGRQGPCLVSLCLPVIF